MFYLLFYYLPCNYKYDSQQLKWIGTIKKRLLTCCFKVVLLVMYWIQTIEFIQDFIKHSAKILYISEVLDQSSGSHSSVKNNNFKMHWCTIVYKQHCISPRRSVLTCFMLYSYKNYPHSTITSKYIFAMFWGQVPGSLSCPAYSQLLPFLLTFGLLGLLLCHNLPVQCSIKMLKKSFSHLGFHITMSVLTNSTCTEWYIKIVKKYQNWFSWFFCPVISLKQSRFSRITRG